MDGGQSNRVFAPAAEPGDPASAQHPSPSRVPSPILARLWAVNASEGLSRREPGFSARTGLSAGQTAALNLVLMLIILMVPARATLGAGLVCTAGAACFACLAGLRLLACLLPPRWAPRRTLSQCALPRASIIVALYRESAVLPVLIAALDAIDYPADQLEICLALEADDHETIAAAQALALDARYRIILVPEGGPRTKPRALNYALRFCSGEIVTIHDAEDRPHPRQLRTAAESFAAAGPELACLQAPLNWFNRQECWLTRQFALEYAAHFHAMLPLYARLGWPLPLGGTSNHFRAAALRRAGGWDAWNVTEDADLGFRLHELGYRSDVISPVTLEEAPTRLRAWLCQRTRWIKGYAQTLGVHSRGSNGEARRAGLALAATLGASLGSALLHAPLALACLAAIANGQLSAQKAALYGGFLLAGYASSILAAAIGMRRAGLSGGAIDLLTMPLYWPLQSLAAVRALYQLATRPYFWDKTEHGVSTIAEQACISHSPPHLSCLQAVPPFSCSDAGAPASPSAPNEDRA